jgi:hypothetical protein
MRLTPLDMGDHFNLGSLLRECFTQKSPDGMGRTDIF